MTKPIIMTDASCDLPGSFIMEKKIPFLGLICNFKGKDYEDSFGESLSYKEFYEGLRKGELPYTCQINEYRFTEKFKELLKEKRPIIYIGLSSGISGTFNSAKLAKEEVLSQFGDADITLIDSKSASMGLGILVYNAYYMAENGCTGDEIVSWVESNKLKMNHWFMVEDLKYLKKGGRIPSFKANVGSLLNVKPIMCIQEDGTLKSVVNLRGRKKAIKCIAEKFKEKSMYTENQIIGISHGDCLEDAMFLEKIIKEDFPNNKFIINILGFGMAAHCGCGTLSLFFLGNGR